MKPKNLEIIHKSFEIQAENFESKGMNFSKEEYLEDTLSLIAPNQRDVVLEVAAGTCVCGRSFAPLVRTVVCLDTTVAMLQIGKQAADHSHIENVVFVKGYAEALPFLDNSFDIVFSRLAFHHFTEGNIVFSEMVRVLKPNGKLVMIDMEATEEALRTIEDEIETLRDPSHVKNLSKVEMQQLFLHQNIKVEKCITTEMQQNVEDWLKLTNTLEATKKQIIHLMQEEINGGAKTGFYPYQRGKGIYFNQRWVLMLGKKSI